MSKEDDAFGQAYRNELQRVIREAEARGYAQGWAVGYQQGYRDANAGAAKERGDA